MGDDLIDDVLQSWGEVARANALYPTRLRPLADMVVARMRDFGYEDEHIRAVLIPGG